MKNIESTKELDVLRCEYCKEGERNVATFFTKEGKLVCDGCVSWYGLDYAPLWARKEISTLTYVYEEEEGDWVALYYDNDLQEENHSISAHQVLDLLQEKGIINFKTKDGTKCIKGKSRFPRDLNEVF